MDIAKNQNTFAKRQREMEKKRKAEAKRARRNERKQAGNAESAEDADLGDRQLSGDEGAEDES